MLKEEDAVAGAEEDGDRFEMTFPSSESLSPKVDILGSEGSCSSAKNHQYLTNTCVGCRILHSRARLFVGLKSEPLYTESLDLDLE